MARFPRAGGSFGAEPSTRAYLATLRCADGQRDEVAACHSMTSSASASNLSGISTPSAFAVAKLMTRSIRQLDRHVGGLRSFENPAGVVAGTAIGIGLARSVAHQEAGLGETAQYADCGQRVASRQRGELSTSA